MLVSLKELRKYVDIADLSSEEIAKKLTDSGIEVEEVKKMSSATNLIIGQVIECKPHPNSDHLHICKVDIGSEVLDIVCGAPNVRKDLKVIVAQIGAKLGDIVIKAGKIRGETSNGMLCSLLELGVDSKFLKKEQIEGIEELDKDAVVGNKEVLSYLNLDDEILDLSLLANRSDCYSIFNIARELGALFNRKVNIPTYNYEANLDIDFKVGSESKNSKALSAIVVKNIIVKESSKKIKDFLRSQNIRSINNIVDLGNIIMLLTGQPIHVYDLDKLEKNELIIKDNINEKVIALDEKEYNIEENDLVVTSNSKPVCIAGIMGLKNVEVDTNTKNIVIEAASFNGINIRKTSLKLGLSSDSSTRFIKGINEHQTSEVLNLMVHYITNSLENVLVSKEFKFDERDHELKEITLTYSYINKRLGTNFSKETINKDLTLLNFKVIEIDEDNFKVIVPPYRNDVSLNADISEEIIRYEGFDKIISSLPSMETTTGGRLINEDKANAISTYLLNQGINEVLTYTLINEKENELFKYINNDEGYKIFNPLTNDHEYVRRNILYSVLEIAKYNLSYQNKNFGLFEISDIETKKSKEKHLAIVLVGKKEEIEEYNAKNYSFYDMKGYLLAILNLFNILPSRIKFIELTDTNEFHPGRSAKVLLDGKLLAVLGEIHPLIKEEYNIAKESVVLMEMNLSKLFDVKSANNKFKEISKFPTVSRDYAFIISKDVNYEIILKEIKSSNSLIKEVKLFDLYDGKGIEENKISIALSVLISSNDHTLSSEEIALVDKKIREVISSNKLNAILRS